jgi:PAS domain S-box-containing protein
MMTGIIPGKMKRPRWLWLAGALFLFVVLAVMVWNRNLAKKSADHLTSTEKAWLKVHPVIRLAPDPDFPPVEYFAGNGGYSGLTADYVALIEKKLGIRIDIVRLRDWDEVISRAKSRQIDVYVATKTPQRAEYMLFTKPFLEFPAVIIAREIVKGPLTLEKLNGMKVSMVSEYAAHNFIAYKYPKLNLDLVPDVETGLRKVAFGLSDAFVENLATATYYIEKQGITNLRIAGESGFFYRMGFCTRKDWPELNRILEKGLAAISADERKAIYKKWIPVEPRSLFTSREFQAVLLAAVAANLMIVAGIIAWNRALARQVRLRTGELENELAERRMVEGKLRFTQYAIDNSADYAFWMTEDGRLFYVNDAACRALGYSRGELLGMSIPDIDPDYPPEVFAEYWRKLRERGSVAHESRHRAKDGRVYPVEIHDNFVVFDGKEYNCAFMTDISERKRAEEALRESEENFRVLAETIPAAIIVHQGEEMVYLNPMAIRAIGYAERDYMHMKFWDPAHDDFRELVKERGLARQRGEDVPSRYEYKWVTKGGEVRWALLSGARIEYRGKPAGIATLIDITDRKHMEEELRIARDELEKRVEERTAELAETVQALRFTQFAVDRSSDQAFWLTSDGRFFYVNDAACDSLGYTPDELVTMSVPEINPTCSRDEFPAYWRVLHEHGKHFFETCHRAKDGRVFPVEIRCNLLMFDGKEYCCCFVTDITERKRAEESLRESEARLKMAMDLARLAQWEYDVDTGMFTFDDQFYALYGTTAEREGGTLMSAEDYARKFIPPEDSAVVAGGIAEVLANSSNQLEHRVIRADGEERFIVVHSEVVHDETGCIVKTRGANQDITERKRAEELLRKSEIAQRKLACELAQKNNFLRTLIDAIPDLIFYKDCNRAYLGCNRAFEAFAGRPQKDLVGRTDLDIFSRDVAVSFRKSDLAILSTEESQRNEEWIDYPDGRRVLLETLKTPFFDLDGEILGVVGVSRDITERKRMEEELLLSHFCIEKAAIGIYHCDVTGAINSVNAHACESLGYSREELCALTVFDIDPEITQEKMSRLGDILAEQGTVTHQTTHRRRDGTTFPVEYIVNLLNFQGKTFGIAFVKDITERKRAEEELLLSQFCIDQAGIGIYQSDETGTIFKVNDHACKSLGYTREELCALSIFDIDPEITPEKMLELKEILDEKGTATHYTIHRRKDGTTFPVEITANHLYFHGKRYAISFVKDITEHRLAEEALRESESRVRRKLDSILDPEGDTGELDLADILDAPEIQALMEDLHHITGLKMSIIDLKGRVLADVGWQDICAKFHRNHPETLKRCHESDTGLTVGIPQGEFRTYRCKNNIWHIVTPIIIGGRHMGNLFMGQFFFADEQIDYDLFRAQARKYGFPEEEYIAALEALPRHGEKLVNLGKAVFLRLTDMFSKLSYANIKLAQSVAERDRLTATLRESEALLKLAMDLAKMGAWEYDSGTGLFSFDDQFYALYGTTVEREGGPLMPAEVYARKFIPPEESSVVADGIEHIRANSYLQVEHRIIRADGEERFIIVRGEAVFDQEGRFVKIRGANQDITERRQAEDSIRESRAKYQAIVDSFDGLIYISSQDYRIEFMNRKLIERTGRDAVGEYCYKIMNDLDSVCPWCVNDRVFAGETVHREMYSPKDNRWYYAVNVPIRHADGAMSKHTMIIDITERKMFEEELTRQKQLLEDLNETLENRVEEEVRNNRGKDIMLIQQNRQAALGEMLDHIAHQWKQPLNSISLIVQDMADTSSDGELTNELVEETACKIMALLDYMAQTIDIFRGFYRPDKEKRVFSIKDSVDQALAFIAPAFRFQSIAVELDVDPGLTAFGYPKEYAQVLLNILANARDVFRARGTENPRVIIKAFAEESMTVVTVTDNAGGIPETIIDKIFDLYFTTNESSGGTGVGLYMSKNIIEKNMGGTLSAVNTEGGAQFRIEISPT